MSSFRILIPTKPNKTKKKTKKKPKKKMKRITWRSFYEGDYQWINELAVSDQVALFQDMDRFFIQSLVCMDDVTTAFKWANLIRDVGKHQHRDEVHKRISMTGLFTPLLISFPDNFNDKEIADIIGWYLNKIITDPDFRSGISFLESKKYGPPSDNSLFDKAMQEASKKMEINHFVFKGVNYFFAERTIRSAIILYRPYHGDMPITVRRIHTGEIKENFRNKTTRQYYPPPPVH